MGKYFEERSKGAASSAIRALLGMSAKTARVVRNGAEVEVPIEEPRAGDVFVVGRASRSPSTASSATATARSTSR